MSSPLAWFAIVFIALIGLGMVRKLVGVVRGERLLARFRSGNLAEEAAVAENVMLRHRFGRCDFRWLWTLLCLCAFFGTLGGSFFVPGDLGDRVLSYLAASFTAADFRVLLPTLQILFPFLLVAIPVIEILDRRQIRALPDPEDPLEPRRPPFRNLTYLAWMLILSVAPLWLNLNVRAADAGAFFVVVLGIFLATSPLLWLLDRRAHYFRMEEGDLDGQSIRRIASEVGTPVRWMAAVADDRTYAKGSFFGLFVISAQFERRFDRCQRETLIRYELARSHPRFFRWYALLFGVAIGIIAISAFTPPWGLVGFITFGAIFLVAFARIEMARLAAAGREIGTEPETLKLVDRYMKLKPSFLKP